MLNVEIGSFPLGPEGKFGTAKVAFVDGKLVSSVELSPKAALDEAAKKIGGPIPEAVVKFIEGTVGLN